MDKGTREVKSWLTRESLKRLEVMQLNEMHELDFTETDTRDDNCFTVAEDETPEFLMYKLNKGYFGA